MVDVKFVAPWENPRFARSYSFGSIHKKSQAVRLLNTSLNNSTNITWLDGGSGSGKSASFFMRAISSVGITFSQIFLVDRNEKALARGFVQQAIAEDYIESVKPIVTSTPSALENMPFIPEHSIDLYTLCSVIEHFDPIERHNVLCEATRVLKDRGILFLICPLASPFSQAVKMVKRALGIIPKDSIDNMCQIDDSHKEWFTRYSLVDALKTSGFILAGEDYYIYGSIRPFWRVISGYALQSIMPLAVRKIFATGGMFTFRKA